MRTGRIEIEEDLYEDHYDVAKRIFEHFRPTMIEYDWTHGIYVIYGVSELFEDIRAGSIPDYTFSITADKVNFERI